MTLTVGKYTFSPWLRKGIGARIAEADTLGAGGGAVKERPIVPVDVAVNAEPIHKDFALLAPGDVVGINSDAVVRTEPRHWVTEAEPNYLAFIEFYDEDLIYRYTPAHAVGERLRPWLALLVLKEQTPETDAEFTTTNRRLPLPSIRVESAASLPPHTQTWAWAHVHTNEAFADATEFEQFLQSLDGPDNPNADKIICRLMSPRRLEPNTAYGAFVVPAFETGRLAGLEQDPTNVDAQQPSWTDASGPVEFPVYYQWRFRTGENEDFEELVKRLEPRAADSRVGIRAMDGEKPGWGMVNGTDLGPILPTDEKQTVVGLEGALKAPTTRPRPGVVITTRPFFAELQSTLNLPETLRGTQQVAELPVISPPIYGEHHALRHTVDLTMSRWLDVLNRDPRTRTAAGFGVRAVQENQENYVARAWSQVQKVLAANRVVRLVSYAMYASRAIYTNLGATFDAAEKVAFFSPLLRKVRGSATTLQHQLGASTLPPAAVSGAMRRLVRPRGAVARRLAAADQRFTHAALIEALAEGRLSAAPPKPVPSDLVTDQKVAGGLPASQLPAWLLFLIRHRVLLLVLALALLLILGVLTGAWMVVLILAAIVVAGFLLLERLARRRAAADLLTNPGELATAIDAAPPRPDFGLVETDPVVPPQPAPGTEITSGTESSSSSPDAIHFTQVTTFTAAAGGDSVEARDFRRAAASLTRRLALTATSVTREPFGLANADAKLSEAIDPMVAFPRRAASAVRFTFDQQWLEKPEHLVPAMAYPDFDDPMYEKLRDLSSELLLPNLHLIPPNTITLLETNPPFIESYLVGLNYEFGKELLWREYPTDRRGSYFRQFWDVRGIIAMPSDTSAAELAEQGRDIVPLDGWPGQSALGSHRNPKRPPGEQLVLTIRGDLLKKYPNTLIYAQQAHKAAGSGLPPVVAEVASEDDIQREIKFPVFKAAIEPDYRFYGFDMTIEQARGDMDPQLETDDWGWFFVIQELPGEPRFGMDVTFAPDEDPTTPLTWNDLAWPLFPDGQTFLDTTAPPAAFSPAGPGESASQWGSDSARMASVLFQTPVMILVHAKEMLSPE
jgi:hypothetical protein